MSAQIPMNKAAVAELIKIRLAAEIGRAVQLYSSTGFFCSTGMQVTIFRGLAGRGLINVVDGLIEITAKGREYLEGVP